jgi:preprotein translocase subunit SecA
MLRAELAQLERFVLLQILDIAWKDHLYAMDLLKDSIGLRGFGERDPRIEYKREGSEMFGQMQQTVRDRVTELIFRAKLTPQVEARSVYGDQEASHAEANLVTRAASAASRGTEQQRADQQAAEHAGAGDDDNRHMSRRQRRAAARNDRRKGGQERVKQRKRKR